MTGNHTIHEGDYQAFEREEVHDRDHAAYQESNCKPVIEREPKDGRGKWKQDD
jgi:hypothetical protein